MPTSISVQTVTTTSVTFTMDGLAANGTVEIQISPRPDFAWAPSPIYNKSRSSPSTVGALNQRATYWARARDRLNDGTAGPWTERVKFRTADGAAQTYPNGGILIEPALIMTPEQIKPYEFGQESLSGFPETNLTVDAPNACRVDGTFISGQWYQWLAWDQGHGVPIDTVALLNTNLPEDATVEIGFSAVPDFTTSTLVHSGAFRASPNLPGRLGYHGLFRFTKTTGRYWYLLAKSSQPRLHAEHLIVGCARQSKNVSIDKRETPSPKTDFERRRTGIPDRQDGVLMRKVEFDISALTETQYETLYSDLHLSQNQPVLVVPNSRAGAFLHDRILFGDLSGGNVSMVNSNVFTRSFAIDSLI